VSAVAILAALLGGLYGVVTRGPTKPVCRVSMPCSAPYPQATLVFTRPGLPARSVKTDAKGRYRVALPAGRWSLRVQAARFGWTPRTVMVPSGRYGRVNVDVDTGIR
jgi:hypothetical protein